MACLSLGIDLGGTHMAAGLLEDGRRLLHVKSVPTGAARGTDAVIDDMASLAQAVCAEASVPGGGLRGVGVGCPGLCDTDAGVVLFADNIGWSEVPLAVRLTAALHVPCRIANDASCAALAEARFGAAAGLQSVVLLTLGTGLGAGILQNGVICEGCRSLGGEFGHTTLRLGGEPCACGRRGCAEAYVSATALIRGARRAAAEAPDSALNALCGGNPDQMNAKMVFDAAAGGDGTAMRVLDSYLDDLGEVLVNAVNLLRPEVILLGGGVAAGCGMYLERLNAFVRRRAYGGERVFIPPVRLAALGSDAGIAGAALLCAQ